jgi:hypothetical protein
MRLSISIIQNNDGFVPHIIFENPKTFKVLPVDQCCRTWKEAWSIGRVMRDAIRKRKVL